MIGTEPGIALNAKSDAMAIIAARPFYFRNIVKSVKEKL